MRIDPEQVATALREAYEQVRRPGPFVGTAPGVRVEVGPEGDLVELTFDEKVYQVTGTTDLSDAIVTAHRAAREAALAGKGDAVLDVLAASGATQAWQS